MEENILKETALALRAEWELELPDNLSEEAIINLLAARIVKIIERGPDVFYQLMYRLDISEKKLNAVLQCDDKAYQIARLIYERQLQKIQSRIKYKTGKVNDVDDELKW